MAKDNQSNTPSLKPEDFYDIQKVIDDYSVQMEKIEQNFNKLKKETQTLLTRIEKLLQ